MHSAQCTLCAKNGKGKFSWEFLNLNHLNHRKLKLVHGMDDWYPVSPVTKVPPTAQKVDMHTAHCTRWLPKMEKGEVFLGISVLELQAERFSLNILMVPHYHHHPPLECVIIYVGKIIYLGMYVDFVLLFLFSLVFWGLWLHIA